MIFISLFAGLKIFLIILTAIIATHWNKLKKCSSKPIILIIIVCWIVVLKGGLFVIGDTHSSDKKMIANFEKNILTFEKLQFMITEDCSKGLQRVSYDFTRPENYESLGISDTRIDDYRTIFKNLDIDMGWECYKNNIWLYSLTSGLSISGSTKGYYFSQNIPENFFKDYQGQQLTPVDDLDGYTSINNSSFTIYRHIKDNWYLFYEYED